MRYRFRCEYLGSAFFGWQEQNEAGKTKFVTVQSALDTVMNGIPLFKVPSSIIPNNRILTVYKNEANEADVSIVFGTLVPFFSTGTIVRKNFYKEAGIASYGDWALLNKRYLGIIEIDGIKDAASN